MKELLTNVTASDNGMTTAEYAVGTVAACGFGGVLITLLKSPEVQEMLLNAVTTAFEAIF